MLDIVLTIAAALAFLAAVMLAGWVVQARSGNPGWSDVFWTFGVGLASVGAALVPLQALPAPSARRALIAGLCAVWSLRLGLHIATRVARSSHDARYVEMRERLGSRFQRAMLGFMLVQAPVGAVLALAALAAAHAPGPLGAFDLAAAAILSLAIAGEGLADAQLNRFKADPGNRGKVCDVGLWGWSRHPNYVFEWLVWMAFPVAALGHGLGTPWPWLTLGAPALMYLLLTRVSGVPPLERAMLASRGEAFRAYQARVPAFFPIPRQGARP
jgi:steroid 5-alpha reductase family enzyme